MIRLDKFISDLSMETRKTVKNMIKSGRIKLNGSVCKNADIKIDENRDIVEIDGKALTYSKKIYIVMNKPAGVVCSNSEPGEKTVFDILPQNLMRKDIFTVGRLDKDTVGLLIITNDGDFSHRLMSPKKHIEKVYYAEGKGTLSDNAQNMFEEGMQLGRSRLKPAKLEILESGGETAKLRVIISEGKYHQVKRMFYKVGIEVTYLKRLSLGGLTLDESLKEGSARIMTEDEIEQIFNI